MTPEHKHFYLARLTIETVTPLSIAAGPADGVFDVSLVRDANGLPALPGSSLAGVLRHLHEEVEDSTDKLFGYQHRDDGAPSWLHVSWGHLQDSDGRPVEGLLLGEAAKHLDKDQLLRFARDTADTPVLRDRVRISHRGAAAGTGKFDRAVLPAGFRFSVELSLWSERGKDPRWERLLGLLHHPLLRLGGATRAGLGRIRVEAVHQAHFDLSNDDGRTAYTALSRAIGDTRGLQPLAPPTTTAPNQHTLTAEIHLTPRAFWRIGQGEAPTLTDSAGKPADLLPKLEQRVVWNGGKGRLTDSELLIPAASVKGALAHRVAFHANRLAGHWAEDRADIAGYDKSEHCEAVKALFGYARDDDREDEAKGRAGRLYFDDAYLAYSEQDLHLMMHNAIDRFSGGVRDHVLFSEELVWDKGIDLCLTLDTRGIDDTARRALALALEDLCRARLALGGGAAKGHGFFEGKARWSDGGAWIGRSAARDQEEAA